jgi:hypothetical protein
LTFFPKQPQILPLLEFPAESAGNFRAQTSPSGRFS